MVQFFLPRHARCFENVRFDQCPIGHFKVKKKTPMFKTRVKKAKLFILASPKGECGLT